MRAGDASLAIAAEVIVVPPWRSNPILPYVVVLSLGWTGLAGIVAATSGALAGDSISAAPGPPFSRVVQIDGTDPCTNDLIVLNTYVVVNAATIVQAGQIRTNGVMTLTGWVETGSARDDFNVAVQQRFNISRAMLTGMSAPAEVQLKVVDRPTLPSTILVVQVQETWEGMSPELRVTDSYLGCA